MALRVDVGQDSYKERSRLLLRNQLPTAGLTELWEEMRGEMVTADLGKRGDGRQNREVGLECIQTWATYRGSSMSHALTAPRGDSLWATLSLAQRNRL